MRCNVLYHRGPAWLVGERQEDAVVRRRFADVSIAADRYPEDYPGRVISVAPAAREFSAGDLAGDQRGVAALDLTTEQAAALRARELKIDAASPASAPVAVTFVDRYGATAADLRELLGDADALDAMPADDERRVDLDRRAVELRRALPRTVVHTGAGLYEVGPGKTYSTIQSALDQLWADQGSATFTASQYVRVFAGTFAESWVPNASLNPAENTCATLIIEGDPADSRDDVILEGDGSANIGYFNCDHFVLRHLKINCVNFTSIAVVYSSGVGSRPQLIDCHFTNAALDKSTLNTFIGCDVTDCDFDCPGVTTASVIGGSGLGHSTLRRTKIKAGGSAPLVYFGDATSCIAAKGCTFHSTGTGRLIYMSAPIRNVLSIRNCTFYGGNRAIDLTSARSLGHYHEIVNCVFKDQSDYALYMSQEPSEAASRFGPEFLMRSNYFHGYSKFAYAGGDKTFAEFTAGSRCDSSGDVDGVDPLLADPDNDDFSLQSGSPCRGAGHGSGVVTDYLGTAFDANKPDVGAWSSGAAAPPSAPALTAADDGTRTSATLTIVAGDPGDEITARYRKDGTAAWTVHGATRTGSGTLQVTGLDEDRYVFIATAERGGETSIPSDPAIVVVTGGSSTIRSLLDQALDAYQGSDVAWENAEYDPTVGTAYLRPTFLPGEPEQADLGTAGENYEVGMYQVDTFHPTGRGAGEAEAKAGEVRATFKRGTVLSGGGITVRIEKAWRGAAVQEGDWYRVPVFVQWFAYVAN